MKNEGISDDRQTVSEFIKGKVEAFDILYERYSGRLYVFALRLLKNQEDARDVVQETFLKIWQKRYELSEVKSFKSIVFTVNYNIMIDMVRKKMNDEKYQAFLHQYFKFETPHAINSGDLDLLNQHVRTLVDQLPERRREIFVLSRETGLTNREISEKLNISIKTVETHISLALKYIRERVGDQTLAVMLFLSLFY